jgi:hypothetical protein
MTQIKRVILNPANPREARTAAERLVRALDLRATTTSEYAHGWLLTTVWTATEANSAALVGLLTSRHTRARYEVVHNHAGNGPSDYVIIRWKKVP